jgi:hypothetical protein
MALVPLSGQKWPDNESDSTNKSKPVALVQLFGQNSRITDLTVRWSNYTAKNGLITDLAAQTSLNLYLAKVPLSGQKWPDNLSDSINRSKPALGSNIRPFLAE